MSSYEYYDWDPDAPVKREDVSFAIRRGVIKSFKEDSLSFLRGVEYEAAQLGLKAYGRVGTTGVELVRRSEIEPLMAESPYVTASNIEEAIDVLAEKDRRDFDGYRRYWLGAPKLYEEGEDLLWIGAPILEEQPALSRARQTSERILSEVAGRPVELPPVEHYLNLSMAYSNSPKLEQLLNSIGQRLPDFVDVYPVDVRRAHPENALAQ